MIISLKIKLWARLLDGRASVEEEKGRAEPNRKNCTLAEGVLRAEVRFATKMIPKMKFILCWHTLCMKMKEEYL